MDPVTVGSNVLLAGLAAPAGWYLSGKLFYGIERLIHPPTQGWKDLAQQVHVMGAPGCGKSTLLQWLGVDAMQRGYSLIVTDPHGPLAQAMLRLVPREKAHLCVYHRPAAQALGLDVFGLASGDKAEKEAVVDGFLSLLRHTVTNWGPKQDALLEAALWEVVQSPKPSIERLLELLESDQEGADGVYARVSRLVSGPVMQEMLAARPVPFGRIMAEGGVFLLDLSGLGERTANLAYRLTLTKIMQAAMARGDHGRPVMLILDEVQRVAESAKVLGSLLAEARKFNVCCVLAHHHLGQLPDAASMLLDEVGTHWYFRLAVKDANHVKQLVSPISSDCLCTLPRYRALRRRTIHGQLEQPRIVCTQEPPAPVLTEEEAKQIKQRSAKQYGCANRREGRKAPSLLGTQESSHHQPDSGPMVSQREEARSNQLPVRTKAPAAAHRSRIPEAVHASDGRQCTETMGGMFLPF